MGGAEFPEALVCPAHYDQVAREIPFGKLRQDCVVGIDDVRDRRACCLRDKLIRIKEGQAHVCCQPVDELGVRDPESVLQRPEAACRHNKVLVLETRPIAVKPLDHVHCQSRMHRALDSHAAHLSLTLAVVSIADTEESTLDIYAQVDCGTCLRLWRIHVPAERLGHKDIPRLACGGRDAYGAVERSQRELDGIVAVKCLVDDHAPLPIYLVDPDPLG